MSLLSRPARAANGAEDRPVPAQNQELNAVLGKGSTFEGKLAFEGTVHINGVFTGEIHSKDTLVVGEGAKVQGEIHVGTLVVNGEITGNVRARQLVEMHAPARVRGTVHTPVLVIDRGVMFEGSTKMENLEPPKDRPAASPGRPASA
jgi:cytoskeletal protein CcmA (bactofilin family)